MKKIISLLIILSLAIIFGACPPLEEDDEILAGETITFDEPFPLDVYKWFEILDSIGKERKYVKLDLSKGTYVEGNEAGGLIKVTAVAGVDYAFDPFPAASSGKNYIVSIILPAETQMISHAVEDSAIIDNEEDITKAKESSAFRFFTSLRSVRADNVTLIGNFAFADCKNLNEVIFPRVGHMVSQSELEGNGYRVDIGKYAFMGCAGLKDVKFNSAAVIGEAAFKECTGLSNIDFPEVWMIENNAFEGCAKLTNVFFEKASKIGVKAFKDCTSLKKAEFNVKPERFTSGTPLLISGDPVYDSVIFYPSVFSGCKAFGVLNVRRAWNVYFSENVLAHTSSAIEIYLFDEPISGTTSFGHPQNALFLGDTLPATSLNKVEFFVPVDEGKIQKNAAPNNIKEHIQSRYKVGVGADGIDKRIDVSVFVRPL
ncbi:MAG: leucine-rich repeat domain-containing protein [Treponema sp.]|jgi:hypothetical protein|nr:leucine-rich repeat domain-containing protein [Treponema sp.]